MKIPFRLLSLTLPLAALLASPNAWSADDSPQRDFSNLRNWSGVTLVQDHEDGESQVAELATSSPASFTYPDGEKGWYRDGHYTVHDGSGNWRNDYGVRFDLHLPTDAPLSVEAVIAFAPEKIYGGNEEVVTRTSAKFGLTGKGWHTVTLPMTAFDFQQRAPVILETVKTFSLEAASTDDGAGPIKLRNPQLVKADILALESEVRSASAKGGGDVVYELEVTNCTDQPQIVNLTQRHAGMEVMETTITPSEFTLEPGKSRKSEVRVTVSERVAPGGRESQVIQAVANGRDAGEIEYITLGYLEHPYLLHNKERWDAVREKAKTVDWAKAAAERYIEQADEWVVPEINRGGISRDTKSPYLFNVQENKNVFNAAVAYQLTGDKQYAEKVAEFLRKLNDPVDGYTRTQQAGNRNLVKEGGFFQHIAWAYDMIYNAGVLSDEDHANMATTFRAYQKVIDQHLSDGTTGNWQVAEMCGALYGALAVQDMVTANRFIEGPGGFYDQMSNGVMGDGWWYECSIGYNAWVASEFTQLALAMQPFGVDYVHAAFPATYSKEYNILPIDAEQRKKQIYGKPFQKWGPTPKPYVTIKDMWDALPPLIDYNGVMFANNDSTENKFEGDAYEIAYSVYPDPTYATIIKNMSKRDLLYGVPDLPEDTPELGVGSAFADNAGQAMLRSNAKEPRERIQAVLKYGTHGGYHGHFDRTALNSLMRYGRSFYNPEHIWYSYPNFMYAFFVQASLPHNMVVVDMKQQEAVESEKLMFETGDLMQTTAVETKARWSNPPYGGLRYATAPPTFQEKCWQEGRYMPVPENEPEYGSIGEWSDRVTQRRLMAVTDDYVVLADYLEAPEEHTYDCLFNIKGFLGIESDGAAVQPVRHTEQMDPDPVLPAQLITDCDWYETKGTTKVSFETRFGKGADNAGTRIYGLDGVLKMDVYNAWPKEREVMIGSLPEAHGVNRKFWYTVKGDDNVLAEGKFGAWILGRDEIDVPLDGVKQLTLVTKTDAKAKSKKTLFWGDPVIVTADGKELPLSELEIVSDQIDNSPASGVDYYGGPVKLSGRTFEQTVPANPVKEDIEGTVTLDLSGLNAVRFKAFVGGDYPLGNEDARRKSLSFRTSGKKTQYLTVIEPFEDSNMVKSVTADSANEVTIELTDGRKHVLEFKGLDTGKDLSASIKEFRDGKLIREENTND